MMTLPWRAPRIAVVEMSGVIGGHIRANEYVRLFKSLTEDERVRAVVLDVDSPGGSATASDYLYMSLDKLTQKKPVIAFIRGHGTSGAYLLSCAASRIVAIPSAVIGSIGVISVRPMLRDLMQKLGVQVFVTKSGPFKDMGSVYRAPTEEERQKEQELIDEFFHAFVDRVASARKLDTSVVKQYATGEIFTARRGKELGLVDELGDVDRAVELAMELGKVPRRLTYVRPRRPLRERLLSPIGAYMGRAVMSELERLLLGGSIYLGGKRTPRKR